MELAVLGLKMCMQDQGDIYQPYHLDGDWAKREKKKIQKCMTKHVPDKVDSMFNFWIFWKQDHDAWVGHRSTWDRGTFFSESLDGFIERINEYYSK